MSTLEGVPFVKYKGPTGDYTDECEIKVQQKLARHRRESDDSPDYAGEYYNQGLN